MKLSLSSFLVFLSFFSYTYGQSIIHNHPPKILNSSAIIEFDISDNIGILTENVIYSFTISDNKLKDSTVIKHLPPNTEYDFFDLKVTSDSVKIISTKLENNTEPNSTSKLLVVEFEPKGNVNDGIVEISYKYKVKDMVMYEEQNNSYSIRDVSIENDASNEYFTKFVILIDNLPSNVILKRINLSNDQYKQSEAIVPNARTQVKTTIGNLKPRSRSDTPQPSHFSKFELSFERRLKKGHNRLSFDTENLHTADKPYSTYTTQKSDGSRTTIRHYKSNNYSTNDTIDSIISILMLVCLCFLCAQCCCSGSGTVPEAKHDQMNNLNQDAASPDGYVYYCN